MDEKSLNWKLIWASSWVAPHFRFTLNFDTRLIRSLCFAGSIKVEYGAELVYFPAYIIIAIQRSIIIKRFIHTLLLVRTEKRRSEA